MIDEMRCPMPQRYPEARLTFEFPDSWKICRPGESFYYTNGFQSFCGGSKETDFLAFDPDNGRLWLLEVKDYSVNNRTKPLPIHDEVALKVRDTLALLSASMSNDHTPSASGQTQVGDFGRAIAVPTSMGVVLHCEHQPAGSKLFPSATHLASIQQKLRIAFKNVISEVKVTCSGRYAGLAWNVT